MRDPPQPVQPEHVVDSQERGVLATAAHERAPEREATALGGAWKLRWQTPVLTIREQLVGRCSDGDPGREQVRMRPPLEAVGMPTDRQVERERGRPVAL